MKESAPLMRQTKILNTARELSPCNKNKQPENTHTMVNLYPRYWITHPAIIPPVIAPLI